MEHDEEHKERGILRGRIGSKLEHEALDKLEADGDTRKEVLQLLESASAGYTHVAEVFCPIRYTSMAKRLGLVSVEVMDWDGWDVQDPTQIADAWRQMKRDKPYLLVGPGVPQVRTATLTQCIRHLQTVCLMFEFQHRCGRFFVRLHPWGASSWHLRCIQRILGASGVGTSCCGLRSQDSLGVMSNSALILEQLVRRYAEVHWRSSFYKGYGESLETFGRLEELEAGGSTVEETPRSANGRSSTTMKSQVRTSMRTR